MIRRLAYSFGLILLLALLGATWLFSSQAGLMWLVSQVDQYGSISFSTEKIEGSLKGPIRIHDMKLVTPAGLVEAGRLEVRWNLAKLLTGELSIENISFTNATYKQKSLVSAESVKTEQSNME